MRRVRTTIITVGKQEKLHILSVNFVDLGIHHAMGVRRIFYCGLSGKVFFKKVIEHKMCVLVFFAVLV
jgi:hypothetical protein